MPAFLDFSLVLETPDDVGVRRQLLGHFQQTFYRWLGSITKIWLVDYKNQKSETSYLDITSALNCHLGVSEILIIDFAGLPPEGRAVLCISKNVPSATVYTMAISAADLVNHPRLMSDLLLELLSAARILGIRSAVAAGEELEIEESIQSISGLVTAASSNLSLIEYLCIEPDDLPPPAELESITERDRMLVLRRRSSWMSTAGSHP